VKHMSSLSTGKCLAEAGPALHVHVVNDQKWSYSHGGSSRHVKLLKRVAHHRAWMSSMSAKARRAHNLQSPCPKSRPTQPFRKPVAPAELQAKPPYCGGKCWPLRTGLPLGDLRVQLLPVAVGTLRS